MGGWLRGGFELWICRDGLEGEGRGGRVVAFGGKRWWGEGKWANSWDLYMKFILGEESLDLVTVIPLDTAPIVGLLGLREPRERRVIGVDSSFRCLGDREKIVAGVWIRSGMVFFIFIREKGGGEDCC